ncbi:hypothetical protein MTsPCn9_07070 [Croceitalea sp. MTPC9]|uniref:hypothetical protein n=1 Tax=unclassified Croceitalea TaxID=2632280 RepID=UPI002B3B5391|nr:hypothetical protein MTsPCn6_01640 [Croceitalea sp. MTPC6]GMN15771.1 hypothetical protein MTsPCn9_07070 [Croceitalea sp. MTPC9]
MKIYKTIVLSIALITGTIATAQEAEQSGVAKESTKKTYKLYKKGELIKNSVLIETTRNQVVMLDKNDKEKINQDRIIPPTVVVKTVKIDNDADDLYDEVVKFSYTTKEKTDFTLVSSENDLMLAVEDGENITILENMTISMEDNMNLEKAYVFTMEDGKEIELKVESFQKVNEKKSK